MRQATWQMVHLGSSTLTYKVNQKEMGKICINILDLSKIIFCGS